MINDVELYSQSETFRLDYMPIVGHALRRLRIRELVDERVPTDPRSAVSAGECIEALIVAIVEGKHTLYRVDELLERYDLEVAFGWSGSFSNFNDTRLARALDEVFAYGPAEIHTAVMLSAVQNFELELKRLHFDTTTSKLFGDYELSCEPSYPDEPGAVPHVTRGHSKDHRPDLKQILLGLTATADGGVPIAGRAASGNRADAQEARYALKQIAQALPDPRDVTLVADSKFFAGETLLLAKEHELHYLTLLPRSVGIWEEAFALLREDRANGQEGAILKTKESSGGEEAPRHWRGRSYDVVYRYTPEGSKEAVEIPVRALAVHSDALRDRKHGSLERRREKEQARLAKRITKLAKREFKCEADAQTEAENLKDMALSFHTVDVAVRWEQVAIKREKPGRPKKGEKARTKKVWRVDADVSQPAEAFAEVLFRESCFVLVTDLPRKGKLGVSDRNLLSHYDDQHKVETCMRWAKGPLALAPIFLKTPERIAALCMVYVLALMVYGLIQREVRRRLAEEGTTMPGNRGQGWTARPTTEVIFRLFEGIDTLRGIEPTGKVLVTRTNTEQVRILKLLGVELGHDRVGVSVLKPRQPRPGERAWKPRPKPRKKTPT